MHVALRRFITQILASQLPFLANRDAELAVPPLFWPVNCIKIGGHVALLSGPYAVPGGGVPLPLQTWNYLLYKILRRD